MQSANQTQGGAPTAGRTRTPPSRRSLLLDAAPVVLLLCLALGVAIVFWRHEQALHRAAVGRALALERTVIEHTLREVEADLTMLVDDADMRELLADGAPACREAVIHRLLSLLDAKLSYRRAHVIDAHDREMIRIDSAGRGSTPVASVGSSSVFADASAALGRQSHALQGELVVSPMTREARQLSDGAAVPGILPVSANLSDEQGNHIGRITLELRLAPMIRGLRRSSHELGEPLLVDGQGQILLGGAPGASVPEGAAIAAAVMNRSGDGEVATADGDYTFQTLVYRSPRPLRGDDGFLEPSGTAVAAGSGALKAIIFTPRHAFADIMPLVLSGIFAAGVAGSAMLLIGRLRSGGLPQEAVAGAAFAPAVLRPAATPVAADRPALAKRSNGAATDRSHAFLDRILNTVPQPIFVKDRNSRFLFVNDALCGMTGYHRDEMLGCSDYDLFPPEQADGFVARDAEVFGSHQCVLQEETLTDARGEAHVLLTRKAACTDTDGSEVLVGVITDITERKRTEEMLRLSAEVFEHSAEGILITDDRGLILNVNGAFTRISGYGAQSVIGNPVRMLASGQLDAGAFDRILRSIESNGFWTGEIVSRRKNGELYVVEISVCAVRDDHNDIRRYIGMMSDITQRKNNEERMRYLAQHDFLTGLANRHLLQDRVSQAILHARRSHRKVGLLLLDLDGFKEVNDSFGHEAGDQVLQDVGARLTRLVRQTDTVARIGGDEFVAVLTGIRSSSDADRIARKVLSEVSRPFTVAGGVARVGVSIGVALYPEDGEDWTALSRVADRAMYREKHARSRRGFARLRP